MKRHSQISSNLKKYEIDGFSNVYNPLYYGSELELRKLIMDIKSEDSEIFYMTMTHNW